MTTGRSFPRPDDAAPPAREVRPQHGRRVAVALVVVLALALPRSVGMAAGEAAAPDVEAQAWGDVMDPKKFEVETAMVSFLAAAALALKNPLVSAMALSLGTAYVMWSQSVLFTLALPVEERILSAWAVESLLELDYQVRGAVNSVPDYAAKLREDARLLEARISAADRDMFQKGLTGPELERARAARVLDEARLEAVERLLPRVQQFSGQEKPMLAAFDALRARIIAGDGLQRARPGPAQGSDQQPQLVAVSGFNAQIMTEAAESTRQLVAYMSAAADLERLMFERVPVPVPSSPKPVLAQATAMEQLRLVFDNESANLVFFVRQTPAAGAGAVSRPRGRRDWMVVYPKGAALQLSSRLALGAVPPSETGPIGAGAPSGPGQGVDVVLPSTVWFPINRGDRLEVRVATYGPHRQLIRWLSLRGRSVRPTLDALRRSFYYVGYETPYRGQFQDTAVHRYAIDERYTWTLDGAWAAGIQQGTTTDLGDVYGAPPWVTNFAPPARMLDDQGARERLVLANDRVTWTVPAAPDEYRALAKQAETSPYLSARVAGSARMVHAVRNTTQRGRRAMEIESGEGVLTMKVEPW